MAEEMAEMVLLNQMLDEAADDELTLGCEDDENKMKNAQICNDHARLSLKELVKRIKKRAKHVVLGFVR